MPILLFLALAVVYAVGLAGVVVIGSLVGEDPAPLGLEARLARVRVSTTRPRPRTAPASTPYYVRVNRRDA
jgi:hypothetical protein